MTVPTPLKDRDVAGVKPDYQVAIVAGDVSMVDRISAVNIITVDPPSSDPEEVVAAVGASGVRAADVRSKTLLVIGQPPDGVSALAWTRRMIVLTAAVWGVARRRPDFLFAGISDVVVDTAAVQATFQALPDSGRPGHAIVVAAVGEYELPEQVVGPHVTLTDGFGVDDVTTLRFARRLLWTTDDDVVAALAQLSALAGIRVRGEVDRLPALWCPEEASDPDGLLPGVVCDLTVARRGGERLRSADRADDRFSLAPAVALTDRQVRLEQAAAFDVRDVLDSLGARSAMIVDEVSGEQVQVWHCLHPHKHTNNDATPSARVGPLAYGGQGFRCMRCLPERVDALRLVMWAKSFTVDDAAAWLFAQNLPVPTPPDVAVLALDVPTDDPADDQVQAA